MIHTRSLDSYLDIEVNNQRRPPHDFVREWIGHWSPTYEAMIQTNAYYDIVGLISARWEFLGGLLRGTVGNTNYEDAVAYSEEFLEKIQPRYQPLHKMSQILGRNGSDLFTMIRNKPLHGMTPAPVYFPDPDPTGHDHRVVTWWIGTSVDPQMHLVTDTDGALHIRCQSLRDDLLQSMAAFADYLESGSSPDAVEKFRRGFWARFQPVGYPSWQEWQAEGRKRQLFT